MDKHIKTKHDIYEAGASAMLAALLKWLDEPCNKHPYNPNDYGITSAPITTWSNGDYYSHRKDCPQCMAELRGEK
jgi:hypothetical protein